MASLLDSMATMQLIGQLAPDESLEQIPVTPGPHGASEAPALSSRLDRMSWREDTQRRRHAELFSSTQPR